ncbi:spore germination protein [Tannockella kyphosi]|uniref:spore germination protein n=1 Tax=Tannockella kyphosi TaxID=2899121 RepID=UPI002012B244|nr:spore germination protein [Tannockella kyphosi]
MGLQEQLDDRLQIERNFDIVKRELIIKQDSYYFYFIDGFIKDEVMERMMEFFIKTIPENSDINRISEQLVPYVEVEIKEKLDEMIVAILSGSLLFVFSNQTKAICIDVRTYPTRGMQEPEDDRVLRGSRDGFVETIIFNTALIRRRIRDERLVMEYICVGSKSKTDIVLSYLDGVVDKEVVTNLKKQLENIQVQALTMAQESLAEVLVEGKWISPFPKVRYSERPDMASSCILEGKIVVIIDNCPSVLILPTYFLDFLQVAQDYYMPPMIGTYLRIVRIFVFFTTLLLTPLWYYFNQNPELLNEQFSFLILKDVTNIPIILQFLILEYTIDALKLASLNTPSSLSGSFSILGALLLGDFAVKSGWFNSEIILYMAYVALANFTLPSYEMGYAIKFMRVLFLVLICLFPKYGQLLGIVVLFVVLYRSKTISKQSYLYPLIPFDFRELKKVFIRTKIR